MGLEGVANGNHVVVGHRECVGGSGRRYTWRIWLTKRKWSGAGLDQQVVGMPVIAAVELDNRVAAGESPGQAQGGHGGFGAGADEAHQVDAGEGLLDESAELDFGL